MTFDLLVCKMFCAFLVTGAVLSCMSLCLAFFFIVPLYFGVLNVTVVSTCSALCPTAGRV